MIVYSEFLQQTIDLTTIISIEVKGHRVRPYKSIHSGKYVYSMNVDIKIKHLGGTTERFYHVNTEDHNVELLPISNFTDDEDVNYNLEYLEYVSTQVKAHVEKKLKPLIDEWKKYKGQHDIKTIPIGE